MPTNSTPSQDIPVGFCQCGCGQRTNIAKQTDRAVGWVRGQPLRFLPNHQTRKEVRYQIDPETGCWNWTGCVGRFGYGKMNRILNGEHFNSPHRYYYTLHKGPIPDGMPLDHLCRNRRCVNPDHLEPVTFVENIRRGDVAKLTPEKVKAIKLLITDTALTDADIALRFDVIPATIWWIRTGRTWRDT